MQSVTRILQGLIAGEIKFDQQTISNLYKAKFNPEEIALFLKNDASIRETVVNVLICTHKPIPEGLLEKLLNDANEKVALSAFNIIENHPEWYPIKILVKYCTQQSRLQWKAIATLRVYENIPEDVIKLLISLVTREGELPIVKRYALHALAPQKRKEYTVFYKSIVNGPYEVPIRGEAIGCLDWLREEDYLRDLLQADNMQIFLKEYCIYGLRRKTSENVAALERVLEDSEIALQRIAQSKLKELTGQEYMTLEDFEKLTSTKSLDGQEGFIGMLLFFELQDCANTSNSRLGQKIFSLRKELKRRKE